MRKAAGAVLWNENLIEMIVIYIFPLQWKGYQECVKWRANISMYRYSLYTVFFLLKARHNLSLWMSYWTPRPTVVLSSWHVTVRPSRKCCMRPSSGSFFHFLPPAVTVTLKIAEKVKKKEESFATQVCWSEIENVLKPKKLNSWIHFLTHSESTKTAACPYWSAVGGKTEDKKIWHSSSSLQRMSASNRALVCRNTVSIDRMIS